MKIDELAKEYENQYRILLNKIEGLRPLLCVYRGQDLLNLRRRIRIYYDMAAECRSTSRMLRGYYGEE